jgi:hypothetical protein
MESRRDRISLLKQLYERKFIEESRPVGLLQKVLSFQHKINDFKSNRAQGARIEEKFVPYLGG